MRVTFRAIISAIVRAIIGAILTKYAKNEPRNKVRDSYQLLLEDALVSGINARNTFVMIQQVG